MPFHSKHAMTDKQGPKRLPSSEEKIKPVPKVRIDDDDDGIALDQEIGEDTDPMDSDTIGTEQIQPEAKMKPKKPVARPGKDQSTKPKPEQEPDTPIDDSEAISEYPPNLKPNPEKP